MAERKGYQITAPDWRGALVQNRKRTRNVVVLFIVIYVLLGLLVDLYINAAPSNSNNSNIRNIPVNIEDIFINLLTFKIIPVATLIMLVIALLSILITLYFHRGIMMLGTEYHEILPESKVLEERQLYNIIEELKIAAGLGFMPKVFIIEAEYMNAFASGYSEKSAMVSITRGLLQKLDRNELQAVMAHELSHVRHDDIRLTLMVAVLSNLMLIAVDLLFRGVLFGSRRSSREDNKIIFAIVILRFLLPIITILLVLYLSRTRELMADAGSVELMRDNEPLIRALLKIDSDHKDNAEVYTKSYASTPHEQVRHAAYLYDPSDAGISALQSLNDMFSTHPSLQDRLKALGATQIIKDKV